MPHQLLSDLDLPYWRHRFSDKNYKCKLFNQMIIKEAPFCGIVFFEVYLGRRADRFTGSLMFDFSEIPDNEMNARIWARNFYDRLLVEFNRTIALIELIRIGA